ncbi:MAG: LLM class flavin-dependent oxidoreductase [Streptosporangiales bacterium]|nr:LLM class flavin-dependent oxidoreductase [Streptosporangiales bacterium]
MSTVEQSSAAGIRLGLLISRDEPGTSDPVVTLAQSVERATRARDAGFEMISVAHRYSFGPSADADEASLFTWRFQPFLMLAYLAARLGDTVDYATSVLVSPGLHPVQLAEDVATLDAMCHGRLKVGIGLGWMPYEFEAFGVTSTGRARRFDELLETYRALTTQDSVTSAGPHFPVAGRSLVAHGIQRPVPLWIGASADAAVRRAARYGDAWVMTAHMDVATLVEQQRLYHAELARWDRPRPARVPVNRMLAIAEDRDTALREIRPMIEDWYRKRGTWGWFLTEDTASDITAIGDRWIVGDPDDCVEQILALRRELGATDVILATPFPGADQVTRLRMIDLVGEHVIPRLAAAAAESVA